MARIQRYILVEVVKVFAMAFAATTLVMTVCVGLSEGLKLGLPMNVTLRLLPAVLSESLRMTVPVSLLYGVCSVFGRMAADGELTAVKALGVHPLKLFLPPLWLAIGLSLGTFVMYEVCARWARPAMQRTLVDTCDEIAYAALRKDRALHVGQFSMVVREVSGRRLLAPRLRFQNQAGHLTVANAKTATLDEVAQTGLLRVSCQDLHFTHHTVQGTFPRFTYDIPFRKPNKKSAHLYSPAELPAELLDGQIRYEQAVLEKLEPFEPTHGDQRSKSPRHGRQTDAGNGDSGNAREANLAEWQRHARRLYRLRAEYPRRMANGFSVLAFVMIGIPVAARSASSDAMTVFFWCMLPITLLYYPLLVAGENIARQGVAPELSVWLAPAVLMALGIALFLRWTKH